jgi:hypothetical protein
MVKKNNNYMPNNGPSDFHKEIVVWLRSIGVILFTYLCGFIWMGLSDHFKLDHVDKTVLVIKPQHEELWQTHKFEKKNQSPGQTVLSQEVSKLNVGSN